MDDPELQRRLSQISTRWSMVFQAHRGDADAAVQAQERLVQRYGGAIYRYLLGAVRDTDAAEELAQEFALRLVRGDFRRLDPQRGRFRDYVKTALIHLVADWKKRRKLQPLHPDLPVEATPDPAASDAEAEFIERWREELLARTWRALARFEERKDQPVCTVLRFRAENPGLSSTEMAERLGVELQRPLTAAACRQLLHRAREKFAQLLFEEVAASIETTEVDLVEQELNDLGLKPYYGPSLRQQG